MTQTHEAAFETVIETHLLGNGHAAVDGKGFDRERAIFPNAVLGFIPDGCYCPFAAPVAGTRQGKTVLVQMRDSTDPETGERYTVKRYESARAPAKGSWRHAKITLKPNNPDFPPIELGAADEGQLQVIAECVEVLGRG